MTSGKVGAPGRRARNPAEVGEPELWKAFQKRGTIELLTLLRSDQETRMREVLEALPGISKQTLVSRLTEFGSLGIIHRRVDDGPPLSTWYSLTALGAELAEAAKILVRVGNKASMRK